MGWIFVERSWSINTWIGGRRANSSSPWYWSGRISTLIDYSYFGKDQPNDTHQVVCLGTHGNYDFNWDDFDCHQYPRVSIGIISDGKVIYEKHFGMQDIRNKIPVSNSTSFNLASISKQFTGMCIALLEEQEKIHLSDNISKYFPQFQFPDTIKIKNLLDHSSGIRDPEVIAILAGHVNLKGELPGKFLNEDFLFNILSRELDLNFPTGSEMAYTNINPLYVVES